MHRSLATLFLAVLTVSFALGAQPDILLVDDGNKDRLEGFYGPLCLEAARTYQVWTVSESQAVPATGIDAFRTVVWLTGGNPNPAGIEGGDENLLRYVKTGGRLVLIGDHVGGVCRKTLAEVFGLEFRRHNTLIERTGGRLPDAVSQGLALHLAIPGCDTARYLKRRPGRDQARAETVFFANDRGESNLTAARIESLETPRYRAAWFGFELQHVKDLTKAAQVFTRTVRWVTPEPPPKAPVQQFPKLWKGR
ncbi:MAG: hypothetical protein HY814_15245 [Candidatus Riflebacteria bacterium]|nr:hypothetical protein [Candidatus Riflebacteria bacterium]